MKLKENKAKSLVDNALNDLIESIEKGQSETLQRYLQALGKFHNYSFYNTLLIALQRPDATHVAGFVTWKKLGRFIKAGEKGIAIITPLTFSKTESSAKSDTDENIQEIKGFKVAYVFDISQTDGKELPEFSTVKGDPKEYSEKLNQLISSYNIKLEYVDNLTAYGYSSGGKIIIRSGLSPAEDFSVRVHELAHELLHQNTDEKLSKKQKEAEAEAVAYVVCTAIGLDTNTACADYIQLYNGDKEMLLKSFGRIQKIAGKIFTGLFTHC